MLPHLCAVAAVTFFPAGRPALISKTIFLLSKTKTVRLLFLLVWALAHTMPRAGAHPFKPVQCAQVVAPILPSAGLTTTGTHADLRFERSGPCRRGRFYPGRPAKSPRRRRCLARLCNRVAAEPKSLVDWNVSAAAVIGPAVVQPANVRKPSCLKQGSLILSGPRRPPLGDRGFCFLVIRGFECP